MSIQPMSIQPRSSELSEIKADNGIRGEMPEIKRPLPAYELNESLSEWEQARNSSKTWSMGQD